MVEGLEELNEIKMELIGKPNVNEFAGRVTPQIFIEDYEVQDGTFGF